MIRKRMVCTRHFLNESDLICLRIGKLFQVLLCNTNNLIQYQPFIRIQLNGYVYDF